jgi:tyrosine-protein kinase Etk/Wzc
LSFHELINIILRHFSFLWKITLISAVFLFLILFFIYPKKYRAEVSILPPDQTDQSGTLSSLLNEGISSGILNAHLNSYNSELFVQILKSRTAALYVVKKCNLVSYYGKDTNIVAADELMNKLDVSLTKEGIVKLQVDVNSTLLPWIFDNADSLKRTAAFLSNTFVEALDSINNAKLISKAKRARRYIEEQLMITKMHLDSVELALMKFQEKNKAISLSEQVTTAIDAAAKLKADIVQTEIELGFLETNLRQDNQTMVALKNKLKELRKQYDKMQLSSQDYLLAFSEVPELGKQLSDLVRDVKIQNQVYLMLQQQYYQEKIQENRDIPTVEILDEAIPPLKASSPRVILSTIVGCIFIFLLLVLYLILKEKQVIHLQKEVRGA